MLIVPLSLSDRFRGALLGAALGEILGANYQHRLDLRLPAPWLEVDQWGFESVPDASGFAWGHLAIEQVQAVTQLQNSSIENSDRKENSDRATSTDWMGLTIATLPVSLFYHDDWQKLQAVVQEQLPNNPYSANLSRAILAIAYTLRLTLQEQLHLPDLIPQLITALDLYNTLPPLAQQLDRIQIGYQEKVGLSTSRSFLTQSIPEAIGHTPVTIALHSFLQTPLNFQISLIRTARLNHQPQIACAIAGALSGAYNGIGALPLLWRRRLQAAADRSSVLSSFWQVSSEAELLQHADLLLAAWSGVYAPHSLTHPPQALVTASPGIIRPR